MQTRATLSLPAWMMIACSTPLPQPQSQAAALAQTRATLSAMAREDELPGIAYAQTDARGLLLEAHAGHADARSARPVSADTMFMTYSVTKVLTAVAVLQLVDRGLVDLHASLERYVPEHPYGPGITIAQLLAHTAGVPNPMPLDWFFTEGEPVDRAGALRRVLHANGQRASEPGAKYGYSNIGYWLLEQVIEAASKQGYAEYVREHVLRPVGVDDHDAGFALPAADRLATGHIRQISFLNLLLRVIAPSRYWLDARDGWSRLARVQSWGLGYGGAYATPRALAAVLRDLLADDSVLLSKQGKAALLARAQTRDGAHLASTLGLVTGELDGVPYFGKHGGGLGFEGNVRIYPSIGLATVYFANCTQVTPGPIDARSDRLDNPMVRWRRLNRP